MYPGKLLEPQGLCCYLHLCNCGEDLIGLVLYYRDKREVPLVDCPGDATHFNVLFLLRLGVTGIRQIEHIRGNKIAL